VGDPKTRPTGASVRDFVAALRDPDQRRDARAVGALMRRATGARPEMWGASIVGFGRYRQRYASGRELEWMEVGFSPRARRLTLYLAAGLEPHRELLARLGPHRRGASCLHLRRLADVDPDVLEALVRQGVARVRALHAPAGRAASRARAHARTPEGPA
jgi:hypothetical protein